MSKVIFVPRLPTKAAYANRAFPDYYGSEQFINSLISRDGPSMRGYIYFKDGIVSSYKDGTEPVTYDTRKWHELGYTSCARGCCTTPPNDALMAWKPEDGQESLSQIAVDHLNMSELSLAEHMAKRRSMPKFKQEVVPLARGWQEFKKVSGPGGLAEQFDLIKDKTIIKSIFLVEYGYFHFR